MTKYYDLRIKRGQNASPTSDAKLPRKLRRKLQSKRGVPLDEFLAQHPDTAQAWKDYCKARDAVKPCADAMGMTVQEYWDFWDAHYARAKAMGMTIDVYVDWYNRTEGKEIPQ